MAFSSIGSGLRVPVPNRRTLALCLVTSLAVLMTLAFMPALGVEAGAQVSEVIEDGRLKTDPKRDWFDVFVGVSQIVTALAAAIGIPFIALQFKQTRDDARSQRTASFQERYQSRDFLKLASPVLAFLSVRDAEECVRKIEAYVSREHADDPCLPRTTSSPRGPKASVNDVAHVLSFFEDLATAFNRRELADEVILRSFVLPPPQVFAAGWWFIFWRRDGKWWGPEADETQVWAEYQSMVKVLRRKSAEAEKEKPDPSLRVLCLPANAQTARSETWARARRLTKALSAHLSDLAAVCRDLENRSTSVGDAPKARAAWDVLLISHSPDISRDEWQNDHALAARLSKSISSLPRQTVDDVLGGAV